MMGKYLISAIERRWAVGIARDKGLKANQWVYVPFDENERKRRLLGRRVLSSEYLIGYFTDEEKEYLIYPRSEKNAF
jgi:hypothetical protein